MVLCANRPESFGPHSTIHPHLPTTCFLDTIVVPLATWLYLLSSPLLISYIVRERRWTWNRENNNKTLVSRRRKIVQRIAAGVYYFLVLAMLAMASVEIARLRTAGLGSGLLPFIWVGVCLAGFVHVFTPKGVNVARVLSALYWGMLALTMAIKLAALVEEEGTYNRVGVASKYPLGDEVTDLAVMIGVEVVLAPLEFLT